MVSPERRAWSRAAASDFSDGSIPVSVAPGGAGGLVGSASKWRGGGGLGEVGEVRGGWGRLSPAKGSVELPSEKPSAALEVAQARPVLLVQDAGFMGESERVSDLAQRREG